MNAEYFVHLYQWFMISILHVLNNHVAHPYLFLEADQGKQENIATNKKFSLIFCCPVFFV